MELIRIYVSRDFHNLVLEFIKKFKNVQGVDLNFSQATDLITKKIIKAGGLAV
jgi:hypothetical protein